MEAGLGSLHRHRHGVVLQPELLAGGHDRRQEVVIVDAAETDVAFDDAVFGDLVERRRARRRGRGSRSAAATGA